MGGTPSTARSAILQATRRRCDQMGLTARRDSVTRLAKQLNVCGA